MAPDRHSDPSAAPAADEPRGFEVRWLAEPWQDLPIRAPIAGDGSAAGCSGYDAAVGWLIEVAREP